MKFQAQSSSTKRSLNPMSYIKKLFQPATIASDAETRASAARKLISQADAVIEQHKYLRFLAQRELEAVNFYLAEKQKEFERNNGNE